MYYNEVGQREYCHRPEYGTYGRSGELLEVLGDVLRIAVKLAECRGEDVLQAPSRHYCIVARDDKSGEHAHAAHQPPCLCSAHLSVGASRIGCSVAAYDEFVHHTGYAEHQHARYIYKYKGGSAVLTGHVWKAPYIAQSYRRTRRCENHSQFASEVYSFL